MSVAREQRGPRGRGSRGFCATAKKKVKRVCATCADRSASLRAARTVAERKAGRVTGFRLPSFADTRRTGGGGRGRVRLVQAPLLLSLSNDWLTSGLLPSFFFYRVSVRKKTTKPSFFTEIRMEF